jgi:hypothetical protein
MTQIQNNLIDSNEILLTVVRQIYDQFDEEEIKGTLGRTFNYIISLECFDGFIWIRLNPSDSFRQREEPFDGMLPITNIGKNKELLYNTFHNHQNNSTNNINILIVGITIVLLTR